ncbi:MAG: hypothetical protein HRU17_12065 [Polyangiaceae bacterium]|nr:hypothetical protein [Polyangiaceae bacterium]
MVPFRFVGSALLLAAALSCCSSEPDVGGSKLFGAGSTDGSTARPPPADVRSFVDSESSTPTGSQPGDGCTKVDFLFVIDRSGSMTDFQNRLNTAFPGFINAILEQVPGTGHHIMVVDSDGCENTALLDCAPDDAMADCPGYPVDECTAADYSGCGDLLGGGIVLDPRGDSCGFPEGRRYLTTDDENLSDIFQCVAAVGADGSPFELPFTSMVKALSPELVQAGGCAEGFLRDDALLVVTVVSDDEPFALTDDDALNGDPLAWYDSVVAAKNGSVDDVVMIGFVRTGAICEASALFVEFIELFDEQGELEEVCGLDYADAFASAVERVSIACAKFDPARFE